MRELSNEYHQSPLQYVKLYFNFNDFNHLQQTCKTGGPIKGLLREIFLNLLEIGVKGYIWQSELIFYSSYNQKHF